MIPSKTIFNSKPLFLDESRKVVLGKGRSLFRYTAGSGLQFLVRLPESPMKTLIRLSRWLVRMTRHGFGCGICYQGIYIFTFEAKIYSFNPAKGQLRQELAFAWGRGPLSFTLIEGIAGFEDGIYFGEYLNNQELNPVGIYKRNERGYWNEVFSFSSNQINHIHSLVADHYRNCVWILTGDFEHSASIWMAKDGWREVIPILAGDQSYRSCVAFPIEQGLLYAMDTQMTTNSLKLLTQFDNIWIAKNLLQLNGPTIYGCDLKDYFIFATATEPSQVTANSIFGWLDCKPGDGILANHSVVYSVEKNSLSVQILFSKKKDFLPYRLFQFGSISFPNGSANDNILFAFSTGNVGNDLSTEVYDLDAPLALFSGGAC
jgi:hypothetical protein